MNPAEEEVVWRRLGKVEATANDNLITISQILARLEQLETRVSELSQLLFERERDQAEVAADQLTAEEKQLIRENRKISAVRLVRDRKRWSLRQAKDFVDDAISRGEA